MSNLLHIATFNIHKGFSHFNLHFSLQNQRDQLRKLSADIIFLQEVQDAHIKNHTRLSQLKASGQLEFLADSIWQDFAYGKNSAYPEGHHGNAILSKFPIIKNLNHDISAHPTEKRGMMHSEIEVAGWDSPLHTICLHLGLFAQWRRKQLISVAEYINKHVPANAPLIVAGDFNDWSNRSGKAFAEELHLHEVFEKHTGKTAKSFPAWMPMLSLDRIYVRGFEVKHAQTHYGAGFLKVSDHAILSATLIKT